MEGFQEFEARRRKKFDKQIDSNVMIGSKGLDEGVDLWEGKLWRFHVSSAPLPHWFTWVLDHAQDSLLSGFLFSQLIFLCMLTLLNMHYIYFTLVLLAFLYIFHEYPSSIGRNFDKEQIVTFAIHMSFESVSVLLVQDVLTLQLNIYK